MQSGRIENHHCKLYYCDQWTGRDHLSQWGDESEMRVAMERAERRGEDVWLIDPNGKKYLPQVTADD